MNTASNRFFAVVLTLLSVALFSFNDTNNEKGDISLPYKAAGLTERQAAAHLISRFTFGARPGDVDAVVKMGLEKWFMQQVEGGLADGDLEQRLGSYDALKLSNTQIVATYPRPVDVVKMAVKDGFIEKQAVDVADQAAYRKQVQPYMQQKGIKPQRELYRQFANQKIVRAVYSNNQLHELLTDFWFNHFNVSITKRDCAEFIPAYERDVIRPNVTAKFEALLLATAKSPAMLMYLDNFSSAGTNNKMLEDNDT